MREANRAGKREREKCVCVSHNSRSISDRNTIRLIRSEIKNVSILNCERLVATKEEKSNE